MKLYLNGLQGGAITYLRGSDLTLQCWFVNDDGSAVNLTSPAVTILELFVANVRLDTPPITLTVTPGAGQANGLGTVTIQDTDTTLARGTTYYVWGKWASGAGTGVGTTILISSTPSTLTVR